MSFFVSGVEFTRGTESSIYRKYRICQCRKRVASAQSFTLNISFVSMDISQTVDRIPGSSNNVLYTLI